MAVRLAWTARMLADALRQARFPFRSEAAIRQAQERRISATIAHAREYVPYYRETMRRLLLSPADLRTAEDLARLPLLEREQLQRDPEYFVSERWPANRCVMLESGGTSGAPIQFFCDPGSFLAEAAHYERLRVVIRRLAGRHVRYREAVILPPDSSTGRSHQALNARTLLPKSLRVELRAFPLGSPSELVADLGAYRPDVLGAYGSVLEALFTYVRTERPAFEPPRVAVYGADPMSLELRGWVRDELGVEVLSNYGAIEAPHIGFECERNRGYHLNVDLHPIRLLPTDGSRQADGMGEVVVSNLVNRGTVILNYRLGDVAARSEKRCECGRNLPLLAHLDRTKLAWLDLGAGAVVHAQLLRFVLHREPDILRFQVVQPARRELLVRLVARPRCERTATAERIANELRRQLPDDAVVRIEFVADLPRTAAGKTESIVPLAVSGP